MLEKGLVPDFSVQALAELGAIREPATCDAESIRDRAKLAYNSVAGRLAGEGPMPQATGAVDGLDENLRLQEGVARKLTALRHAQGALNLETIEARPMGGPELPEYL